STSTLSLPVSLPISCGRCFRDGGIDVCFYLLCCGGLRQKLLKDSDFGLFFFGCFSSAGLFKGGDGFAALLDLFFDNGGDGGVVQFAALVDFLLLDRGLKEAQRAQARSVLRAHGCFDGFA